MTKRFRFAACAGASLAVLAASGNAWAQGTAGPPDTAAATGPEADSTDASQVSGEIVVTAQFRKQRLQDTPLAITAFDAATIDAKNQNNLQQVADSAPNVTIKPQSGAFGPSVTASIRGVGQNDFNPAFEPGVGIYIDDIYYPQLTGATFDVLDLDRIEILRGPQGTLAGRNSIGGAIKLYSKRPDRDPGGFMEASYGSRDLLSLRAAANFALTDSLFVRISGVSKKQDGYVDQLDFGCVYPAGGPATFVNNAGQTVPINPAGGYQPRIASSNCRVGKLSNVDYQAIRGVLRWVPNDSLEVNIIGDYTRDDRNVVGEVLLKTLQGPGTTPNTNPNIVPPGFAYDNRFICGRFCNFQQNSNPAATFVGGAAAGTPLAAFNGDNKTSYRGWGVSGNIEYKLNEALTLTSITGYRTFDSSFFNDPDLAPITVQAGDNFLTNWTFSQELRLNAEINDQIFATVGGYYFKQKSVYDSFQDLRYIPTNPLQFRQPDPTRANAKALFANVTWEVIPDLNITAGIRYTKEAKDQTYFRFNYDGTVNRFSDPVGARYGVGYNGPDTLDVDGDGNRTETVRALSGATISYRGDKVDYRLSVDYRFIPELMVYGTISTGFKGGGSNPRPFNANQLISFGPEKITAYELGFKSDLFDRRVRFNVAAFYNDYKDYQTAVSLCPDAPCAARVNAADIKAKGIEAELFANPVEGLAIDGSVSYLDFNYVTSSLSPLAARPPLGTNANGIVPGDPTTLATKWKASVGAQYEIDMGGSGSLTPRLDLAYEGKRYAGASNLPSGRVLNYVPAYTLLNGRLTWKNEDKDLQISLEVFNITDKYYFYTINDNRSTGQPGYQAGQPGRPREWSLTVRKNF